MSTKLRALALRAATVAVLAAGTSAALPAPAASGLSCVDPEQWYPTADHVFVGSVADVEGERIAFAVSEVWQGDDLAETVWLRRDTDLDVWLPFSRDGVVEDGYSSPVEYVVAVQEDRVLGPCSLSPDDGSDYGVAGAADPQPPVRSVDDGPEPDGSPPSGTDEEPGEAAAALAAGGAGLAGAGALGVVLWRRRRT